MVKCTDIFPGSTGMKSDFFQREGCFLGKNNLHLYLRVKLKSDQRSANPELAPRGIVNHIHGLVSREVYAIIRLHTNSIVC